MMSSVRLAPHARVAAHLFVITCAGLVAAACDDGPSKTQPLDVMTSTTFDITYPDSAVAPDMAVPEDVVVQTDTSVLPGDTETPPNDAVTPREDTAPPPADTVTPPADTVTPPADTVTPPADTVTPPADTVTPPADTVTPPTDVGPDTTCTPSCPAGTCGNNGCGSPCACPGTTVCNATTFQCGPTPVQGNTCALATTLQSNGQGGFTGSGNLAGAGITDNAVVGTCPRLDALVAVTGSNTPDMHFKFVAPTTRRYRIAVTSASGVDVFFALFAGADCASQTCTGYVDNGVSGGVDSREFDLTANTSYRLYIDTWASGTPGAFSIAVTPVCVPNCGAGCGGSDGCGQTCECGTGMTCNVSTSACVASSVPGNTCAQAIALSAGPNGSFVGSGDLKTASLTDNNQRGTCAMANGIAFSGTGTPDQAFTFTPPTSGQWRVAVTSAAGADAAYTLYDGRVCGVAQCLGGVDDGISGGVDSFAFTLTGNTPYTLVVDTYASTHTGAFSIAVTPVGCVPACGTSCGVANGCGGTCACGDGFTCNTTDSTCVEVVMSGNDCSMAIGLELATDGLAFVGAGDLTGAHLTDTIDPGICDAIGTYTHSGMSTKDQVFWFEAPVAGTYAIGVVPGAEVDISFAVFAGLPCLADNCLGYLDDGDRNETEVAEATLEAGEIYYVVVESFSPAIAPGAFTVIVLLPGYDTPPP